MTDADVPSRRHLRDMGKVEVERFLTHLATVRHVYASTQNQPPNASLSMRTRLKGHTTWRYRSNSLVMVTPGGRTPLPYIGRPIP